MTTMPWRWIAAVLLMTPLLQALPLQFTIQHRETECLFEYVEEKYVVSCRVPCQPPYTNVALLTVVVVWYHTIP